MNKVCCLLKNPNGETFNVIEGEECPNYVGCIHNKYCGAKQPQTKEENVKIEGHNIRIDKNTYNMFASMEKNRWKNYVKK